MSFEPETEPDCEPVTMIVTNARPVESKNLFALVDVEMRIAGVALEILGVQARRMPNGTAVELPAFKDTSGAWLPAIRLPPELRGPLADAVLQFLLDEGLARPRFAAASG